MADNFWISVTRYFLEVYAFISLLLHVLPYLLKHAKPTLEAGRELYLYVKSWKGGEVTTLSEIQPKT